MSSPTACLNLSAPSADRAVDRPVPARLADGNAIRRLVPTTAIVPAAGWGTRLRPLTDAIPKEMLPVGRQPALERIVAELGASGIRQIVFVLSAAKEPQIRRYFGDNRGDVSFSYALQPEMRGLGDAVHCARDFCPDNAPLLIALGDAVYEEATPGAITTRLVEAFADADDAAVGVVVQRLPRERLRKYGVVKPVAGGDKTGADAPFSISDIVEKPAPADAPSEFAVAARFVAPPSVFRELERTPPGLGGEIQLTDALRALLRSGGESKRGVAVPLLPGEVRHDIGSPDTYFRAFAAFALADAECGAELRTYLMQRFAQPDQSASSVPTEKDAVS